MERAVWLNGLTVLWAVLLFLLISSFARLSHGDLDKGQTMKDQMQANDAILETFEVDGEIFDCIDIYKQIAFQHPSLINHTIQRKPTSDPEKIRASSNLVEASPPWHLPKNCPQGSIPIRRIKENVQFGGSPSSTKDSLWDGGIPDRKDTAYRRVVRSAIEVSTGRKQVGARSGLNAWKPNVQKPKEASLSLIWAYSKDRMVAIRAGWMIYASLNGDYNTRFSISWMTDGSRYCYNLRCPGFVHTSNSMAVDAAVQPISVYGGEQYQLNVEISKDAQTSNWWVFLQGEAVGYWPKEVVPAIADGADYLVFGGEVSNSNNGFHTYSPMGSGHYPSEGFQKAAFHNNILTSEVPGVYNPPDHKDVKPVTDLYTCRSCFNLEVGSQVDSTWGFFIYYGGPGTNDDVCSCYT